MENCRLLMRKDSKVKGNACKVVVKKQECFKGLKKINEGLREEKGEFTL